MTRSLKSKPSSLPVGEEKRKMVIEMFSNIAPKYDLINDIMTLSRQKHWRMMVTQIAQLHPGETALDLCTGTGDFLPLLRKTVGASGLVIGLDLCEPMIRTGLNRNHGGTFGLGDTLQIPIQSNSVDAVTVGWGIRNVTDIDRAHQEIFRVTKPGGRFVSIDMAQPSNRLIRFLSTQVLGKGLPMLGTLFGKKSAYTYLHQSTLQFRNRIQLAQSMRQAGFIDVSWRNLFAGTICIHWGMKPLSGVSSTPSKIKDNLN